MYQYVIDTHGSKGIYFGQNRGSICLMPYERSRKIEERFQETVSLIKRNRLNAEQLASELGVSRPTVQRIITELRQRGYSVRSVHDEHGWRYEMTNKRRPNAKARL